jgi:S1-C subfamily serine protease
MGSNLKIGVLSSIIAAAMMYVVLEWRPLASASESTPPAAPEITFAAPPETVPVSVPDLPPAPPAAAPNVQDADEQNNIDIYRRFSRSVVNVASTVISYDFFLGGVPSSGFGSGVVIDDEGHIVTNYHVIQNAVELSVTLADQSRHPVTVVGVDPVNDLALLRVESPDVQWLPFPLGTTRSLQVGQKVLAIGNPFGLGWSLTTGIVSSLGRSIQGPVQNRIIEGVIQTDAAINEGNSGGPLLNSEGELIGISTAKISGATGIGFAIPVETVRRVTSDLLTYGRVRRVYLGIDQRSPPLSALGAPLVDALRLGVNSGVLITGLVRGGPAAEAGIRGPTQIIRAGFVEIPIGGDVIVSLDGRTIRSVTGISAALETHRPGDVVPVTVVRDGEEINLEIELQEEPVVQ